ncbi:MAG: NBR1-Ig-like domain-containing protein [Anaerolineae bacterium]
MTDEVQPIEDVEVEAGSKVEEASASQAVETDAEATEASSISPDPQSVGEESALEPAAVGDAEKQEGASQSQAVEAPAEGTDEVEVETSPAPPEPELGAEEAASEPAAVSLAEMEAQPKTGRGVDPGAMLEGLLAFAQGHGWVALVVIAVFLLLFLLLPPVSLAQRLFAGGGYTTLSAEEPTLSHPDGLTVALEEGIETKMRVKLDSVPRVDFMAEDAPSALREVRSALPDHLVPKSPYYVVDVRKDEEAVPLEISAVIPNEAEPWETLDLYGWTGEAWTWLPARLDRTAETLTARVDTAPEAVLVVQTEQQALALVTAAPDLPPAEYEHLLTGLDLTGLSIGTLGGLRGDPALLPPGNISENPVLAPTVRNWVPDHAPNYRLVQEMLTIESDRTTQVQKLTSLVQNGGYRGLVVDYRGLSAASREAYTAFIAELARALHEQGAWLAVTVETPQQTADGWETAGYDIAALGAVADQVRVYMPETPQAYQAGGLAEALIAWVTSQVNRYKVYPIFSSLSYDGQRHVALEEILASLPGLSAGEATLSAGMKVEPRTSFDFRVGEGLVVQDDPATGATQVKTAETSYWLGTPAWLRSRLELANRYNLGGVVVLDMLAEGNLPGVSTVLQDFRSGAPTAPANPLDVKWTVTSPGGEAQVFETSLTQPQFTWQAPEVTGTYTIAASVVGVPKGEVTIAVRPPQETGRGGGGGEEEVPSEEEVEAAEEEAEETTAETEGAADALKAAFVADVTVPDNSQFEKGEKFTKTWRLRNAGEQAWPADTALIFVVGEQLAGANKVEVGEVAPGEEVDISVEMTAPNEDGVYKSQWALSAGGTQIPGSLVYTIIQAGEGAPAAEEPPAAAPPPSAIGGGFELGGHIEDGSFPYADLMHYAGMNWAKVQVRYPGDAGGIIAAAHAHGFKIQISALGGAGMVTEPGFNEKIANWVAGIAAAGADAIEVWNEPNLPREWQEGHISPEAYTQLLCASYSAIKAANPNVAVISAALAPTGYFGGCGPNGCDDIPFLQRMYNAGAANCMDYIGAHHNSGATPPSATSGHPADPGSTHHSWFFLPQTQAYYNIFGGTRQLFYTELGYVSPEGFGWIPDTFAWGANTTVAQQAQWLAEVVQLSSQTGMVRVVIVWNVDFDCYGPCGGVQDPQAGYAIIRPDGSCPACETLHNLLGTR